MNLSTTHDHKHSSSVHVVCPTVPHPGMVSRNTVAEVLIRALGHAVVKAWHPGPIPPGDPELCIDLVVHPGLDSLGRGGPYEII